MTTVLEMYYKLYTLSVERMRKVCPFGPQPIYWPCFEDLFCNEVNLVVVEPLIHLSHAIILWEK